MDSFVHVRYFVRTVDYLVDHQKGIKEMNIATLASAGLASALIAGAASADVTVDVIDYSASGNVFDQIFAAGELTGTLTGVGVDVVLTGSENFTWADDFTILINTDADFSLPANLQAGGFSDAGALERITWANGAAGDDGTTCIDAQDLASPIDAPFFVRIGNGYASGGNGTWNGTFTLFGVNLVPAPGALALLGVAGLAGRRRRG